MSENARTERRIGAFYNRTLGRKLTRTHFFAMLFLPLLNTFFYYISSAIVGDAARGSLALAIDAKIPLVEEFIVIYFGCYLFWFGGLFFMACQSSEKFFAFFARVLVCLVIAFCFFIFMPLVITRPEVVGEDIFSKAVRFLYTIDKPYNLFPSLHCFFNWIIYVQIRGKKEYPLALRLFACIFSLAVFASTLFTRQHFVLDVVAGFLLAELSALLLKTPLPRLSRRFFTWLDGKLFTKKAK